MFNKELVDTEATNLKLQGDKLKLLLSEFQAARDYIANTEAELFAKHIGNKCFEIKIQKTFISEQRNTITCPKCNGQDFPLNTNGKPIAKCRRCRGNKKVVVATKRKLKYTYAINTIPFIRDGLCIKNGELSFNIVNVYASDIKYDPKYLNHLYLGLKNNSIFLSQEEAEAEAKKVIQGLNKNE